MEETNGEIVQFFQNSLTKIILTFLKVDDSCAQITESLLQKLREEELLALSLRSFLSHIFIK